MCLPCRAVFLAGAYRWNPLSVLPGKLPSRSAQEAPCTLRADPDNPGGTSRGDGFDVDTRTMGDLTMALLPAVGSRVGILWSGQRILAKVLNAGDPPGIFFVEFFIGRRRAIKTTICTGGLGIPATDATRGRACPYSTDCRPNRARRARAARPNKSHAPGRGQWRRARETKSPRGGRLPQRKSRRLPRGKRSARHGRRAIPPRRGRSSIR